MKNSRILVTLTGLGLAVIGARAASLPENTESIRLPAYTVTVPRRNAVEQQVSHSLAQLRATARIPLPIKTEIPLLQARDETRHNAVKSAPFLIVAKS